MNVDEVLELIAGYGNFDPEGRGYDYGTFAEFDPKGLASFITQDSKKRKHLGSLDPRTGKVLKGRKHPTFDLMLEEERMLDNLVMRLLDGYYSVPKKKRKSKTGPRKNVPRY